MLGILLTAVAIFIPNFIWCKCRGRTGRQVLEEATDRIQAVDSDDEDLNF